VNQENDIITALATPPGLSALAVVRLSGPGCAALVEDLANVPRGRLSGMRRALLTMPGSGESVALSWPADRSYTGEEMVELICHGIPEGTASLMEALMGAGARSALPGEFTGRAWRNGRISEERIMELAAATETGARVEPLDRALSGLLEKVSGALETLEGAIEFQEEGSLEQEDFRVCIEESIEAAKRVMRISRRMQRSVRVFITGRMNAGKSTLMNLLCGEPAALVDPAPGTTRDGARRVVSLEGRRLLLIDTPGFGGEGLDEKALHMAMDGMNGEDVALWLSDRGEEPPDILKGTGAAVLEVLSRSDTHRLQGLRVSSLTGEGIGRLKTEITRLAGVPGEQETMEIASILREALLRVGEEPEVACELLREAETIAAGLAGLHPGQAAVERALKVLCVGK
jgi:tRNA modification GTPase